MPKEFQPYFYIRPESENKEQTTSILGFGALILVAGVVLGSTKAIFTGNIINEGLLISSVGILVAVVGWFAHRNQANVQNV